MSRRKEWKMNAKIRKLIQKDIGVFYVLHYGEVTPLTSMSHRLGTRYVIEENMARPSECTCREAFSQVFTCFCDDTPVVPLEAA